MSKTVLVIAYSNLDRDPRVYRQISALRKDFKVIAAGFSAPNFSDVEFVPLALVPMSLLRKIVFALLLKIRLDEMAYWIQSTNTAALKSLVKVRADLIIANDLNTLPLAFKIKGASKIIFDAHEYSPLEFDDVFKWRFFFKNHIYRLCSKFVPMVDTMFTVCDGIAEKYFKEFGVRPAVIMNAPGYENLLPSPVSESKLKIVHHGAAIRSRHIEEMIEVSSYLDDRFEVNFMLVPSDPLYMEEIKKLASASKNITFHPPVAMKDLAKVINEYDLGFYLLKPVNFNHQYALPNKFFEFVQGRLGVIVGPSNEMAALVRKYKMGAVTTTFNAKEMATTINKLTTSEVRNFKQQSNIAAAELNSEKSYQILMNAVWKLLDK